MNIGVIFGGKSSEHEISVLTGLMTAANVRCGTPVPIYITRGGVWRYSPRFTSVAALEGKSREVCLHPADSFLYSVKGKRILNLDAVINCCHGYGGEDGALAGLLELSGVPYATGGVAAGSTGMDKELQKLVFRALDIPTLNFFCLRKYEYGKDVEEIAAAVKEFPVIVKPAKLGSSIGIAVARDYPQLFAAMDAAFLLDDKVIVEKALANFTELNCAVLGIGNDLEVSEVEQPVSKKEFLDYTEKYSYSEGAERLLPAPIPSELKLRIQELSRRVFKALDCRGVIRVDFLLSEQGELFVNEANTVPGSLASYLFDYGGLTFGKLTARLVDIALKAKAEDEALDRGFESGLIKATAVLK